MLCPKCGAENNSQAELCIHCGEGLFTENNQTVRPNTGGHQRILDINLNSGASNTSTKPVVSKGLNIAIWMGTLIFPIIGIMMGFTYMRKGHPDEKKAGRNWLILGIIMIFAQIVLIALSNTQ
ncbi:zinc-ribbon domain-containing protein [Nitrosomonas cryotolerans]|uniref:Zinc-ribbon domain-containing protein n=1 Tax=Nitrosomonas cryotolerans ATCC 49181 TaxID=1131553 RepID=A0A1N6ITP7_9PROT|nr:zinc ribbon domain-containing protein [Nitrosomonas cryotolerans]SFP84880.1 zinc-ribbon domain-containing protein [Nitrosomonas cryotolerans]SIO35420.1 zinc-ribbon domain-containing protein [Nitrosomonas cryotolerans ATCC 49181]